MPSKTFTTGRIRQADYDVTSRQLELTWDNQRVLERCGLVRSSKRGRVRTFTLEPKRLKLAEDWLGVQRRMWEQRLDRLDGFLLQLKDELQDDTPPSP